MNIEATQADIDELIGALRKALLGDENAKREAAAILNHYSLRKLVITEKEVPLWP